MYSIAVIIPVTNNTSIGKCLENLEKQTLKQIGIYCFIDYHFNNSKLMQQLLEKYPSIKFIVCKKNFSKLFNDMINEFDAEYVMFLNQFSILEENTLANIYEQVKHNNSDIGIWGEKRIDEDENSEKILIKTLSKCPDIEKEDIICYQRLLNNKIYKLDFLKKHNLKLSETEEFSCDGVFNLKCLFTDAKYSIINIFSESYKNNIYQLKNLKEDYHNYKQLFNSQEFIKLDNENKELILNKIFDDINFVKNNIKCLFQYIDFLSITKKYTKILNDNFSHAILREKNHNLRKISIKKYILESLFSLKNRQKGKIKCKVLNILGFEISWKCKTDSSKTLKYLLNLPIKENKIVLIEANGCHGENIPTFLKYLRELGYSVDLIITKKIYKENPMCYVPADLMVNCYVLDLADIETFVSSDKIKEYEYCILTSHFLYYGISVNTAPSFFDYFENYKCPKHGYIVLEHHLEKINKKLLEDNRVLGITDFNNSNNELPFVNTNYFGELKDKNSKNDTVEFITIGELKSFRRNSDILIDAVKQLERSGIGNFKVVVIGRGSLDQLPDNLKKYFEILGRVTYKTLYDNLQKADYFLPLLDPLNIKHERYIKNGTSGSFNLIYGFNKPCIIAEKFANAHYFNSENSIIYKNNSDLKDKMVEAINQTNDDYIKMCTSLSNTVEVINKKSFNNLKEILSVHLLNGDRNE